MNTQRLLLIAAWVASLAVAYLIGGSGEPARTAPAETAAAGAASATPAPSPAASAPPAEAPREEAATGRQSGASMIARARLEMGGGMGGMMNIRGMLRAIAPLTELDDSQLQEALAEVERSVREPQQKMMFYSLLLGQWAETDGPAAMAYVQQKVDKGDSMFDMGLTASVLGSWARRDPEAVWKWLGSQSQDDTNDRRRMMSLNAIFAGMAASNLDAAITRMNTLDEQSRGMALNGIASSAWDEASRRRLIQRSATLPTDQRAQIRRGVATQWVMGDPDAALAWIRSLPADEQKPLRESAGQMMLMRKPEAAAEVMLEGADPKDAPRLYDQIAGMWAQTDARAAGEWLLKQPQGPELDGARQSYARVVAQRDPAAAMDWARSVKDEGQRAASIGQIYQMWRGRDAKAADAALTASGLPPDKVKELQQVAPPQATGARPGVETLAY